MSYWIEKRKTSAGKRYYVTTRVNGKKIFHAAGDKREIAIGVRKELEERNLNLKISPFGVNLTLKQLQASYIEHSQYKRSGTLKTIKYGTNKLLDFLNPNTLVKHVTKHEIQLFKNHLTAKHNFSGINMILNPIISMFQYALDMEWITKNPAKKSKVKIEESTARFLTRKELAKLLWDGCRYSKGLRKIILVAVYTGMRISEVASAKFNGELFEIINSKTGKPRRVPVHFKIKRFLPINGWTRNRIERAFGRAVKRAKLEGRIRFHDLRHTFASNYLQSGGTIADLKLIGGWQSIQSLQIYTHFQSGYLHERMQNYRPS